ncbi:hypothetical protein JTB14_018132 [Gonioctena quinquepunctata]|nr:hypothetical protein JTB14_018132 [Gonioctena quinquepunctata]
MTDESAVSGPCNPKKQELARNITQLLVILEKSDCDEFDNVESVVSMRWDSSDDYVVSVDNIQHTDDADQQPNIETGNHDTNVDWKTNPQDVKNVPFLKKESMLVPPIGNSPIDYFRHIVPSDQFIQEVVEQTNENAINDFLSKSTKEQSRICVWKDLTVTELLFFF